MKKRVAGVVLVAMLCIAFCGGLMGWLRIGWVRFDTHWYRGVEPQDVTALYADSGSAWNPADGLHISVELGRTQEPFGRQLIPYWTIKAGSPYQVRLDFHDPLRRTEYARCDGVTLEVEGEARPIRRAC